MIQRSSVEKARVFWGKYQLSSAERLASFIYKTNFNYQKLILKLLFPTEFSTTTFKSYIDSINKISSRKYFWYNFSFYNRKKKNPLKLMAPNCMFMLKKSPSRVCFRFFLPTFYSIFILRDFFLLLRRCSLMTPTIRLT